MKIPLRVAILCDYAEEGWPSMDLVGAMIPQHLGTLPGGRILAERVVPTFRHRLARWPRLGRNGDRLWNRMRDYPKYATELARSRRFDVFHVVDHSYSQLVHALPAARTVVTCHDLDTFRCLLQPRIEPRPFWFRLMTRRILSGLKRAGAVACDSEATRDALLSHRVIEPEHLHVVHLGTHMECSPDPDPVADAVAEQWLGPRDGSPLLLHVGSNIARKRVDVLFEVFARVKRVHPNARLVKVGGAFFPEQRRHALSLGVLDSIVMAPFLSPLVSSDRAALAALYRRASLVLLPSEAEGFGLPAVEALACGSPLLASDLPVLREVAGDAASYRPVGDVPAWADAALELLRDSQHVTLSSLERRERGLALARRYSWASHAERLAAIYEGLARNQE